VRRGRLVTHARWSADVGYGNGHPLIENPVIARQVGEGRYRRVKAAQAPGDFEVLVERKRRRVLRAHLRADIAAHLGTLRAALVSALRSRATSSPALASLRRT
jgi:hypothetical protein